MPRGQAGRTGLSSTGHDIYALAERLWPLNRSLTGDGVRETLRILEGVVPGLAIHEVPSGTQAFDWTVPREWNARAAWIETPSGRRIADFAEHNLHLVGYSEPIDVTVPLEELQAHLYSLPDQPDAIPYVTSYYSARWGFCLRHRDRVALEPGDYRVHIDATLAPGSLTYADAVLPGASEQEVLLSTYICHPSLGNNELSGPCVTAYLAKWLAAAPRRYTYRIVFIPETIGSIVYLSRHLEHLKRQVIAGFNVTCAGDDRCYSYLPSRAGDTLADRAALHVLKHTAADFKRYTFLDRGSDECNYCAPGVDLPVATLMRSKYGEYPEYHTSFDDLSVITPAGLGDTFTALSRAIEIIETNCLPRITVLGEPQLGKRGLYPAVNVGGSYEAIRPMMDMIAYCDGRRTLLEIAEIIGQPMWILLPFLQRLAAHGLIESRDVPA